MAATMKRILLLEDDFESLKDLKAYLEQRLAWQVELTAAQSLLERIKQERFDLIIIDLMIHPRSLNGENREVDNIHFDGVSWQRTGLEFLRRLRQGEFEGERDQGTRPDVPVIVLSAVGDTESIRREIQGLMVQSCVEKPFVLRKMVAHMRELLEG